MTQPSVSEEMIRALKDAGFTSPDGTLITASTRKVMAHILAHLPAGSEAVKPVAWHCIFVDGFPRWTKSLKEAQLWADQGNTVTPLFAAPPSTPPAANVQEERARCFMEWMVSSDCTVDTVEGLINHAEIELASIKKEAGHE